MKKTRVALFLLTACIVAFISGSTFAHQPQPEEGRALELTLVETDPTVAPKKKWLVGASFEYMYVFGNYDLYGTNYLKADGDIHGSLPGGSVFLGYDNFSLIATYRKGSFDIDSPSDLPQGFGGLFTVKQDQSEFEIRLRYLMKDLGWKHFFPSFHIGYNHTDFEETRTITSPGWVWPRNGTTSIKEDYKFHSLLLGIGAIMPINEYFGVRLDTSLTISDAEKTLETGRKFSDTGFGNMSILTVYWNIYEGLNLEAGTKFLLLDGGDDIGWFWKWGVFGMLGYTVRF